MDAVLITGCSTGIGRATAERLAAGGRFRVYATARDPETLAGLRCERLALDVTDESSMRAAVDEVERRDGAVYGLVNNAGYSLSGTVEETPLDEVRRQFETNVFGLVRLTQLVLPEMRRAGRGRIVNVSSMGGRLTFPGGGYYHASKHALEALSDALRFEVGGFGIDVSVIEPGAIRTQFADTAVATIEGDEPAYAEFREAVAKATVEAYEEGAMMRLGGGPEVVAAAIADALTARRPRTRYRVTASAKLLIAARRALPDRAWDAAMRRVYPRPGAR